MHVGPPMKSFSSLNLISMRVGGIEKTLQVKGQERRRLLLASLSDVPFFPDHHHRLPFPSLPLSTTTISCCLGHTGISKNFDGTLLGLDWSIHFAFPQFRNHMHLILVFPFIAGEEILVSWCRRQANISFSYRFFPSVAGKKKWRRWPANIHRALQKDEADQDTGKEGRKPGDTSLAHSIGNAVEEWRATGAFDGLHGLQMTDGEFQRCGLFVKSATPCWGSQRRRRGGNLVSMWADARTRWGTHS